MEYQSSPTVTSTIDWCEPNHVYHESVAEFWNTLSSFALICSGYRMLSTYKHHTDTTLMTSHVLLLMIGVGSVAFHSRLSYFGQMMDELSMLWFLLVVQINTMSEDRRVKYSPRIQQVGVVFSIILAMLSKLATLEIKLFQWTITVLSFWSVGVLYYYARQDRKCLKMYTTGVSLLTVAWACWSADYYLCRLFQPLQLHAVWHVLSAVALHQLSHVQVYVWHLQQGRPVAWNSRQGKWKEKDTELDGLSNVDVNILS